MEKKNKLPAHKMFFITRSNIFSTNPNRLRPKLRSVESRTLIYFFVRLVKFVRCLNKKRLWGKKKKKIPQKKHKMSLVRSMLCIFLCVFGGYLLNTTGEEVKGIGTQSLSTTPFP